MCSIVTISHTLIMQMTHSVIGVTTYFLGILATATGYNTGFFHRNFHYIKVFKIVTAIIFVVTAKDAMILFLLHVGDLWDNSKTELQSDLFS